jgi:hypothetical protein
MKATNRKPVAYILHRISCLVNRKWQKKGVFCRILNETGDFDEEKSVDVKLAGWRTGDWNDALDGKTVCVRCGSK